MPIKKLEKRVDEEIEAAVNYSEKECTIPDPSEILRGVYADIRIVPSGIISIS